SPTGDCFGFCWAAAGVDHEPNWPTVARPTANRQRRIASFQECCSDERNMALTFPRLGFTPGNGRAATARAGGLIWSEAADSWVVSEKRVYRRGNANSSIKPGSESLLLRARFEPAVHEPASDKNQVARITTTVALSVAPLILTQLTSRRAAV